MHWKSMNAATWSLLPIIGIAVILGATGCGNDVGEPSKGSIGKADRELAHLLEAYEAFFNKRDVRLLDVTPPVIERATDLRVKYNLKTPDALHVATAILNNADVALTGDKDWAKCPDLAVEVVSADA